MSTNDETIIRVREKISRDVYNNEEVYLWNVIQQNPDINLLDYRICSVPVSEQNTDQYGSAVITTGTKWWLAKINEERS